jgi:hypothetical protein
MIERADALWAESTRLITDIIGYDLGVEMALGRLRFALDDLAASANPTDDQINLVFTLFTVLQDNLLLCAARLPKANQFIVENVTDRIEIFLFHHRLF